MLIGVGGCVASQEGAAIVERAPLRRPRVRPADAAPPARDDRASAARPAQPQVDISFPEIEKFDHLPRAARRRRDGVRLDHGRLQQVLQLLRRAVHARRGSQPRRSTTCWPKSRSSPRRACAKSRCSARTSTPIAGAMADGAIADLAHADPVRRRDRRHRAHPLHDLAPARIHAALIEAYANVPKLANHLHLPVQSRLRPHPRGMKRGYTALEYKRRSASCARCGPTSAISSDFIVGFPGETERDFEATLKLDRRRRLRPVLQLHLQPRVPARRPPRCRTTCRCEVKQQRLQRLQAQLDAQARAISEAMVGTRAARAGRAARRRRTRASSPAAPRTTAWSTSPARRRSIGHFVDVRDHRGAAAHPARRRRSPSPRRVAVAA